MDQTHPMGQQIVDLELLPGFERPPVPDTSFASWLRHLPLKPANTRVMLYNGLPKNSQQVHHRVIDIDTGNRDLQQCADAVMRLRAEYLFSRRQDRAIHFNFTSGDVASFDQWKKGYRPIVSGNSVRWTKTALARRDYSLFRSYMNTVFTYAGSWSLQKELSHRELHDLNIGDLFIQGGFPGHAIIIVDKSYHPESQRTAVILAQSYMPAQDIHVLKNVRHPELGAWFIIGQDSKLYTPEWDFDWNDLHTFE